MRKKFYGVENDYIVRGKKRHKIKSFNSRYLTQTIFNLFMLIVASEIVADKPMRFSLLIIAAWLMLSFVTATVSRNNSDNVSLNDRALYYILMRRYWLSHIFPILLLYTGLETAGLGYVNEGAVLLSVGISFLGIANEFSGFKLIID